MSNASTLPWHRRARGISTWIHNFLCWKVHWNRLRKLCKIFGLLSYIIEAPLLLVFQTYSSFPPRTIADDVIYIKLLNHVNIFFVVPGAAEIFVALLAILYQVAQREAPLAKSERAKCIYPNGSIRRQTEPVLCGGVFRLNPFYIFHIRLFFIFYIFSILFHHQNCLPMFNFSFSLSSSQQFPLALLLACGKMTRIFSSFLEPETELNIKYHWTSYFHTNTWLSYITVTILKPGNSFPFPSFLS